MFDITSSKLLILAIVALIVVGPKDLPLLLRTVGKYLGVIRRHAAEFRAQLDEAIREAELDQLKKDFDAFGREMHATVEEGAASERDAEAPRLGADAARAVTPPAAPQVGSEDRVELDDDAGAKERAQVPLAPSEQTSPSKQMSPSKQTGTER